MTKRPPPTPGLRRPGARLRRLQTLRPTTPAQLRRFVEAGLGLRMPALPDRRAGGPMDYLVDSFFDRPGDAVVWANRGGGKTMLGAAATLLDLLFKPGIQVRILGGSFQQAERMYTHLRTLLDRPVLRQGGGVLATAPTQRRVVLQNASSVELLACSQRAVRGTRVQVLRCDEVEEMDREVWSAAQMVTRTERRGGVVVPGRIESLSTMHYTSGLMSELTRGDSRRLYRWNALDVAGRCPASIACEGCALWDDCRGRAKRADGFIPIEDLISQRGRVSDGVWDAEMMCKRPMTREAVYPRFDPAVHVEPSEPWRASSRGSGGGAVATSASGATSGITSGGGGGVWYGGMDLGLRNQTVILWAWAAGRGPDAVLHLAGEYIAKERTVDANLAAADKAALQHNLPRCAALDALAVDPAGHQRSGQTGESDVQVLRRAGCTVRTPRVPLRLGIEAVMRRMDHGLLRLHPRCEGLIEALQAYRYDPRRPHSEQPLKDGPDHACDALRYLVLAFDKAGVGVEMRGY